MSAFSHERGNAVRMSILLFAILQVLVPLLPGIGVGEPIGTRSNAVETIITPAGWAFSIWGPLYTGCLAYAVFQLLPRQRSNELLRSIGWYTAGAFLGNALWAGYTQSFGLSAISVVIILFTLACLLKTYRQLVRASGFTHSEQWFVVLPLSALAAWLTAASIVNVAAALEYHGLDAGAAAPLIGAAVVVVGGAIAAVAIGQGHGNPWFALVFLWALAAIYASGGSESAAIAVATIISAALVAATTIVSLTRAPNRRLWLHART